MSRAGFVLAGGRSTRMGRDKALLTAHGSTLLERVAAEVLAAAGNVTVIAPTERYAGLGITVVPDLDAGQGPLGGILTALSNTRADWNLIVAVDMPRLNAPFFSQLFDAAETSKADCLIPLNAEGRIEPLCGIYSRNCLGTVQKAMEAGIRKVTSAFEGLRVAHWQPQDVDLFRNLNTPQDWSEHNA